MTEIAEKIRDAQHELSNKRIYVAELMAALKRNKIDQNREVMNDSANMKLTNQAKRDAELNRRLLNDPQREVFNEDLKKINMVMSDIVIDIEYNRNILQIKLTAVTEEVF